MRAPWLRVAAAIATLVVVGIGALAILVGVGGEGALRSWALVAVVAVPAGIAAYAIVERLQTGRLESVARQFDTRTLVLMPVAIAVNIVLGMAVASALKIPLYLDSVGTILLAALSGPLAGAATGLLSGLAWSYLVPPPLQSPFAAPFAIVAAVIGLLAGSFAAWGWLRPRPATPTRQLVVGAAVAIGAIALLAFLALRGWQAIGEETRLAPESDQPLFLLLGWLAVLALAGTVVGLLILLVRDRDLAAAWVVVAGVITGISAAFLAAPIAATLFGGVTGSGADLLVAAFRQAGADIGAAVLGQSLISDPIDKVVAYFLVFLILGALPRRTVARFPQGEALLPREREIAPLTPAREMDP